MLNELLLFVNNHFICSYQEYCSNEEVKVVVEKKGVLLWWKEVGSVCFPSLIDVAQNLLCIPATSVSSDRAFSSAGFLFDDRRTRMTEDNLESCVFIRENGNNPEKLMDFALRIAPEKIEKLEKLHLIE